MGVRRRGGSELQRAKRGDEASCGDAAPSVVARESADAEEEVSPTTLKRLPSTDHALAGDFPFSNISLYITQRGQGRRWGRSTEGRRWERSTVGSSVLARMAWLSSVGSFLRRAEGREERRRRDTACLECESIRWWSMDVASASIVGFFGDTRKEVGARSGSQAICPICGMFFIDWPPQ